VNHTLGHGNAALSTLDCLRCDGWCDVVGLVLGLRPERQQTTQFSLDLGAVGAGLAEQGEDLVVVLGIH
jgi:hypothetical protein